MPQRSASAEVLISAGHPGMQLPDLRKICLVRRDAIPDGIRWDYYVASCTGGDPAVRDHWSQHRRGRAAWWQLGQRPGRRSRYPFNSAHGNTGRDSRCQRTYGRLGQAWTMDGEIGQCPVLTRFRSSTHPPMDADCHFYDSGLGGFAPGPKVRIAA